MTEDEIARLIELTPKQKNAWTALVKAVKQCKKERVFFYQCMEHLGALNGLNVDSVVGWEETGEEMYGIFNTGNYPIPTVATVGAFTDDAHHIVLRPNAELCGERSESERAPG